MKVLVDENLPPALARALAALFVGRHEIVHLRDRFGPNVTDAEWIGALAKEGRWIVISGDRRITKNRSERAAFIASGLIGFFLEPKLYAAPVTKQMERLLVMWDAIETQAGLIRGGAMFGIGKSSTRLTQL